MKKSAILIGPAIALTLLFYLLCYFYLPGGAPSAPMMLLFAAFAIAILWAVQAAVQRVRSKKAPRALLLLAGSLPFLTLPHCARAVPSGSAASATGSQMSARCRFSAGPRAGSIRDLAVPQPPGTPCQDEAGNSGFIIPIRPARKTTYLGRPKVNSEQCLDCASAGSSSGFGPHPAAVQLGAPEPPAMSAPPPPSGGLRRVTGTAPLLRGQSEEGGYGLYSYALLTHAPDATELPRYRAFFRAFTQLPEAKDFPQTLSHRRINIFYMPLKTYPDDLAQRPAEAQVDFLLANYDYARGTALLASLPQPTGRGPIITSVLSPLSLDLAPHPVLVQDLSTAQPVLMAEYVFKFRDQVAQQRFWQASTLETFSLNLRNVLETAANGLGMSQEAVKSWIGFFK